MPSCLDFCAIGGASLSVCVRQKSAGKPDALHTLRDEGRLLQMSSFPLFG
jgi:hypothetical protein